MNLEINPTNTPAGTRLLYRNPNGFLKEATIMEWSSSGEYLNWNGNWLSLEETRFFTFVEQLSDDTLYYNKY